MKRSMLSLVAIATMPLVVGSALAQDKGVLDPAEMMAQYAEMSKPGPEHKLLEPFVGEWNVKASMWMDPSAPANESTATAKTEWIMDGRYQRMTYKGEVMGSRFTGESISGFNKVTGEYFGSWIDSMSTSMGISHGSVSSDGKTFTYHGEYDDPMTGGKMKTREVIQIHNNDKFTMTAYTLNDDGTEFKHMVLEYSRKK